MCTYTSGRRGRHSSAVLIAALLTGFAPSSAIFVEPPPFEETLAAFGVNGEPGNIALVTTKAIGVSAMLGVGAWFSTSLWRSLYVSDDDAGSYLDDDNLSTLLGSPGPYHDRALTRCEPAAAPVPLGPYHDRALTRYVPVAAPALVPLGRCHASVLPLLRPMTTLLLALPSAFEGMQLPDPVAARVSECYAVHRGAGELGPLLRAHEDAILREIAMLDACPAMVALDGRCFDAENMPLSMAAPDNPSSPMLRGSANRENRYSSTPADMWQVRRLLVAVWLLLGATLFLFITALRFRPDEPEARPQPQNQLRQAGEPQTPGSATDLAAYLPPVQTENDLYTKLWLLRRMFSELCVFLFRTFEDIEAQVARIERVGQVQGHTMVARIAELERAADQRVQIAVAESEARLQQESHLALEVRDRTIADLERARARERIELEALGARLREVEARASATALALSRALQSAEGQNDDALRQLNEQNIKIAALEVSLQQGLASQDAAARRALDLAESNSRRLDEMSAGEATAGQGRREEGDITLSQLVAEANEAIRGERVTEDLIYDIVCAFRTTLPRGYKEGRTIHKHRVYNAMNAALGGSLDHQVWWPKGKVGRRGRSILVEAPSGADPVNSLPLPANPNPDT